MANRAWKRNVQSLHNALTVIDVKFMISASGGIVAVPGASVVGTGQTLNAPGFGPEVASVALTTAHSSVGQYLITLDQTYPSFKAIFASTVGGVNAGDVGGSALADQEAAGPIILASATPGAAGGAQILIETQLSASLGTPAALAAGTLIYVTILANNSSNNSAVAGS